MSNRDIRTLGDAEARLLLTLASQDKQVFTTDDAQRAVGRARHRINKLLARLSDKRWVLRLRRGLYLILPFEAGVEGTYSVHPFRIVPHLTRPYAIAYWTALHHYGYTEQIPGTIFGYYCRFSADLDFTLRASLPPQKLRSEIRAGCQHIAETTGVQLIPVDFRTLRDVPAEEAHQGRIEYIGPLGLLGGDQPRVKLDLTAYEILVLPPEHRSVHYPYSDAEDLNLTVPTCALDEMLAEKLRAMLRRARARDLYDIMPVLLWGNELRSVGVCQSKRELLSLLRWWFGHRLWDSWSVACEWAASVNNDREACGCENAPTGTWPYA